MRRLSRVDAASRLRAGYSYGWGHAPGSVPGSSDRADGGTAWGVARTAGCVARVLVPLLLVLLLQPPLAYGDTVTSEEETADPGASAPSGAPPASGGEPSSPPSATAVPQPTEQAPDPGDPEPSTTRPSERSDPDAPAAAVTPPTQQQDEAPDPGSKARGQPAPATEAPASQTPAAHAASVAQTWAEDAGVRLVRQHTGEQGSVLVGQVLPVSTWAPGFLDGSEPQAAPVTTQGWATPVVAGEEPVGLLVVEVETVSGTVVSNEFVPDSLLAEDVGSIGNTMLVRDQEVSAWYSVEPAGAMTVTALGEVASRLLAGPIDLAEYGQILRERSGAEPVVSGSQPQARSAVGGWAVWGPVLAVVTLGVLVVAVTVRHERTVTAPLRSARTTMPLGADTIPDSRVNGPRA